jgi:fructokinase
MVIPEDTTDDSMVLKVHAGGGPANTAVALSRLGTPTRFAGRFGRGTLGDLLRGRLAASGVDLSGSVRAEEPATLAIAALDQDGRSTYDFYATATADWHWTRSELSAIPHTDTRCVHTGSLALALEPGGPLIEDLLESVRPDTTISIDPNVRTSLVPLRTYQERIQRWCRLADIIRLSDEDLAHLAPETPPDVVFDQWHQLGVRVILLTEGERGARLSLDGQTATIPAIPTRIADTIGAGDAFSAALLHWLWRAGHLGGRLTDLTYDDALTAARFATHVAALTCAVPGANPPRTENLPSQAHGLLTADRQ